MNPTEPAMLIYESITNNDEGNPVSIPAEIEVLAEEKSVKRAEYYAASQQGKKPELVLEIWKDDYELTKHDVDGRKKYAEKVRYDGSEYNIERTYSEDGMVLELVCVGG